MNIIKNKRVDRPSFKSYLGSEECEAFQPAVPMETNPQDPPLMEGEIVVTHARNIARFTAYSDDCRATVGTLYCTTFKLTFMPVVADADRAPQRNKMLAEFDVALANVDALHQVSKGKKRQITNVQEISWPLKVLELHCKNFQVVTYGFENTTKDEAKRLFHAVLHHHRPKKRQLLFALEFRPPAQSFSPIPSYGGADDWQRELVRQGAAPGYAVLTCNDGYRTCKTLPQSVVVPSSLAVTDVTAAAEQYVDYRPPSWCCSLPNGCSLLRMSQLIPECELTQHQARFFDAVKQASPSSGQLGRDLTLVDLTDGLPSLDELQQSFVRLQELVMPSSVHQLWTSDTRWLSRLEKTGWLEAVSRCLGLANEVVRRLQKGSNVMIKEPGGRDFCCVISCLVQILADPYSRTQLGFQKLIQREWVVMGHPFNLRYGFLDGMDHERCPVFLLFLDCVGQLLHQNPSDFSFSETYLCIIWDSLCMGVFETFLFDCERDRQRSCSGGNSDLTIGIGGGKGILGRKLMASAWDWNIQFSEQEQTLFNNPLYLTLNKHRQQIIRPRHLIPDLKVWEHLLLRWLTPIQIVGGGTPALYLRQCIMVEDVLHLQHKLSQLQHSAAAAAPRSTATRRPRSTLYFGCDINHPVTPSSSPVAAVRLPMRNRQEMLTSSFPFSSKTRQSNVSFVGVPIAVLAESSLACADEDC